MNVLHIISGLRDGGAESLLFSLCKNSNPSINHVVFSLNGKGVYFERLKNIGIQVYAFNFSFKSFIILDIFRILFTYLKCKPQVVQSWLYHADLFAALLCFFNFKPICWGLHSLELDPKYNKKSTILIKKICKNLSFIIPFKIVASSCFTASHHISYGYNPRRMYTINNGIDTLLFSPNTQYRSTYRSVWKYHNDSFIIGVIGRNHPIKDHKTFLYAFKIFHDKNPDVHCIFIGQDITNNLNNLHTLVTDLGLDASIKFVDSTPEIHKVINIFDLVVSSSKSESFGNVIGEAMSTGIPCVCTNTGMPPNIVAETGWVVEIESPTSLSDSFFDAYNEWRNNNSKQWIYRKTIARKRIVESFSLDTMTSKYENLWYNCEKENFTHCC